MQTTVTEPLILTGAYGRKYSTKTAALDDWIEEKDFKIVNGPYCSIRDYPQMLQDFASIYIVTEQGLVSI